MNGKHSSQNPAINNELGLELPEALVLDMQNMTRYRRLEVVKLRGKVRDARIAAIVAEQKLELAQRQLVEIAGFLDAHNIGGFEHAVSWMDSISNIVVPIDALPPKLWRDDGEVFSLQPDGMYVMDNDGMATPSKPYRTYTYECLMDSGVFFEVPPKAVNNKQEEEKR